MDSGIDEDHWSGRLGKAESDDKDEDTTKRSRGVTLTRKKWTDYLVYLLRRSDMGDFGGLLIFFFNVLTLTAI